MKGYWRSNVGNPPFITSHVVWIPEPFDQNAVKVFICPGWLAPKLARLFNYWNK